jgi:hypothetical protein
MKLNDWLEMGKNVDEKAKQEWRNAGQVKRRWFAFAGGVIVGAGIVLLLGGLLGCSSKPTACERQSHSACFPGPKVVAE